MEPTKDIIRSIDQLAILDKYEKVINYLYPIAQSIPRKHGTAKVMFIECLLHLPDILIQAGKSNQVSKIYLVDAAIAHLRFWLRFLLTIKALSPHQLQTSQIMIAEVGAMVGSWIKNKQKQG